MRSAVVPPPPAVHPSCETHVYKVVPRCEIKLDVYGACPGKSRPAVVWIHGGGLIFGSRTSPRASFLSSLLRSGIVVVSMDHRLAPETKLPDIVDDLRDAWQWIRHHGPPLFGIDTARLAVAGSSSGGYLALMSGFCVQPSPRALASFWGFGDITAAWEAEPSAFYRQRALVPREQACRSLGAWDASDPAASVDRGEFYLYCRQQGKWLDEVTGHDPRLEPKWFDAYCPIRNVATGYPPSILIHGTADQDVPCEESGNMAKRLAEFGIVHELVAVPNAGHGLSGLEKSDADDLEQRAASFLVAQLG